MHLFYQMLREPMNINKIIETDLSNSRIHEEHTEMGCGNYFKKKFK